MSELLSKEMQQKLVDGVVNAVESMCSDISINIATQMPPEDDIRFAIGGNVYEAFAEKMPDTFAIIAAIERAVKGSAKGAKK